MQSTNCSHGRALDVKHHRGQGPLPPCALLANIYLQYISLMPMTAGWLPVSNPYTIQCSPLLLSIWLRVRWDLGHRRPGCWSRLQRDLSSLLHSLQTTATPGKKCTCFDLDLPNWSFSNLSYSWVTPKTLARLLNAAQLSKPPTAPHLLLRS